MVPNLMVGGRFNFCLAEESGPEAGSPVVPEERLKRDRDRRKMFAYSFVVSLVSFWMPKIEEDPKVVLSMN